MIDAQHSTWSTQQRGHKTQRDIIMLVIVSAVFQLTSGHFAGVMVGKDKTVVEVSIREVNAREIVYQQSNDRF